MGGKQSSPAEAEISDHDRAVLDLKSARDTLKQYQKQNEAAMARHTEVARELLKQGNRKGALMVVKRKKMAEAMLDKTAAKLDNVQQLINDIEYAKVNVAVFEGLQKGRDALKELNSLVSVEDVEALLDDNADQMAKAQELDDALSARAGELSPEDEADIEAEYQALLEAEALEKTDSLPAAPTGDAVAEPVATATTAKTAVLAE